MLRTSLGMCVKGKTNPVNISSFTLEEIVPDSWRW